MEQPLTTAIAKDTKSPFFFRGQFSFDTGYDVGELQAFSHTSIQMYACLSWDTALLKNTPEVVIIL